MKNNFKYSPFYDSSNLCHHDGSKEEKEIARKCYGLKFLVCGACFMGLLMYICCLFYCEINQEEIIHNNQWLSPQASHYKKLSEKLQDNENLTKENLAELIDASLDEEYAKDEVNLDTNGFYGREEPPASPETPLAEMCEMVNVNMRFDCFPGGHSTREACAERGCCWQEVQRDEVPKKVFAQSKLRPSHITRSLNKTDESMELNVPFCYYPRYYFLYNAVDLHVEKTGISGTLKQIYESGYPNDVSTLRLSVKFETCSRVRIRITDPSQRRWETPLPLVPDKSPGCHGVRLYEVDIRPTGEIVVFRRKTGEPLFDMRGAAPLIYSDQFLQLSTKLASPFVYGLGQHLNGLLLDTYWKKRVMWNADAIPSPDVNLYGSHPFYMVMEPDGNAHGVFLLNSNAIDVILQPTPALTFRTIGGILDFYVFLGPTPDQVISQYTEVVGRPFLPPFWSLGYHQCRFGYKTLNQMKAVWNRTREAGIPFDVQWSDIDYMENRNDFTYDNVTFDGLPEFVDDLHKEGMHFVIIVDPGISAGEKEGSYAPYDLGLKSDVFVKNSSGDLFIGKVWNPKATVFPDFTKPNSVVYWTFLIDTFRKQVPFDGLWIDMNEPSNFWNGQKDGCPQNSSLEHPVYTPGVTGGLLYYKTLCMTAQQYVGTHYDAHNLYGISEVLGTNAALKMTKGIDHPFIISRSTFPGVGRYGGHWTGDVVSDWFNLWKSIGDVLTTNLLGIPMVGADICGFNGNTTVALCNRWMQLGAFYPFSRNHNSDEEIDQDPVALGDLVVKSSRKALLQRYTLLPFLHTLFVKAHKTGIPVAKPLFFKYSSDSETYSIDTQFLWGDDLMIVPVLEEKATSVVAYFPGGRWYDWYTGKLFSSTESKHITVPAPLDTIPLFVSGGSILPCQNPGNTTTDSRKNPFGLVIAEDENDCAFGEMAWNRPGDDDYMEWKFSEFPHRFISTPSYSKENTEKLVLDWIKYFGVSHNVHMVKVNGKSVPYKHSAVSQVLIIKNLALNFKERIEVVFF